MRLDWSTSGIDLHLEVDLAAGRRQGLERALRDAVRTGRLPPGTRLPSTRALAAELGLARGTVTAAYDQLVAEGFLAARRGAGTVVADLTRIHPAAGTARRDRTHAGAAGRPPAAGTSGTGTGAAGAVAPPPAPSPSAAPRYDLRPGRPDTARFPVAAWLRATRRALSRAGAADFGYGDPRGHATLRTALAGYLGRARGVLADPSRIVVTTGYVQALALLATLVAAQGRAVAMEDPGLPLHREVVRRHGAEVVPLPVDDLGARTDLLAGAGYGRVGAVVLTPAHQYPTGVTLHPARRHAAVAWARARDALVIEDDYDGEFRFDRQPVGALQGMAPDHVAYVGTAAKTLAPALRLAWLVVPPRLVDPVVDLKWHTDMHTGVLDQLALADLIDDHAYDRHVRTCRLAYRRRRDLLVRRLSTSTLRRFPVTGIAAGLHAVVRLPPHGPTERQVCERAAARGLAVGALSHHWLTPGDHPQGLVVGYAAPGDHVYPAAVDELARVLRST